MLLLSLLLHDPLIPEGGHLVSLTHPAQLGGCVTSVGPAPALPHGPGF